jgi:hypothetical protein
MELKTAAYLSTVYANAGMISLYVVRLLPDVRLYLARVYSSQVDTAAGFAKGDAATDAQIADQT